MDVIQKVSRNLWMPRHKLWIQLTFSREQKGKGKILDDCGLRNTSSIDLTADTPDEVGLTEKYARVTVGIVKQKVDDPSS